MAEFTFGGEPMVPLRCELCGEQIGVKSPDFPMKNVVPRCYACAALEEAEAILAGAEPPPAHGGGE